MTDSQRLLAAYAQNRSESAFRELVTRYLDLVYSSAFRLLEGDAHRAQDAAQIVFADLARKAGELTPEVMLGGWLHRHTCFVAANLKRTERRRLAREREAMEMNSLHEDTNADFSRLAPLLDETINQLAEADRTAILLRFFEQKDFRAVGQSLDTSEDAARMRVNRALEKLRDLLAQRGIRTTAAALSVAISANFVQAAPVGLALTISAAALAGTTATTSTILATTTKTIAMTTLQKTIVTATVAVLAGAGIYEAHQAANARAEVQALQKQQAPLAEQIAQLNQALTDATNQFARLRDENERLNRNSTDLLRLRGEVAGLKRQLAEKPKPDTSTNLSQPQTEPPVDPAEEQRQAGLRKQQALAKMGYGGNWMLAFLQYAEKNEGQLPTSFDQSAAFLPVTAIDETLLATNQFEIVAKGSIAALAKPESVIVLRELQAQQINGGWVKTYVFADGHVEIHREADGNFDAWEAQRMLPTTTK